MSSNASYLQELNEVQRQAVTHIQGPVMIIAGPGSGKTRVLTYRIAHLMHSGTDPFAILALTFTNKAAREMKERITSVHGTDARNLWMGTFHSVFARLLRIEAPRLGYPANFTIYDTTDSKSLIKNIVSEQQLDDKLYKVNTVYNRISSAKNSLVGPYQYVQNAAYTADDESAGRPKMAELYRLYTERCFRAGAMDFDDLLLKTHELLDKFPDVLYKYQNRFRQVMIDEFQDTNEVQYAIVKRLADVHQNIAIVGDDAQSIYSFRGATIANILNFKVDFPDTVVYKLEQNYRSTQVIVDAANAIISKNKEQLAKKIWTQNGEGNKIRVIRAMSDNEEGKLVSETIFELKMREHLHNKDFAILYRTNAQSRAFEESLRRLNLPYRIYGGISFYQRKEIKDLLAYLKLTVNPADEEAFRRVINYPVRGIGKTTMERMTILADENQCSLWQVAENASALGLGRSSGSVEGFVQMIRSFTALSERRDAWELADHIAKQTGMLKELYADKSVEGLSRYENFQELLNSIKEFSDQTGEVLETAEGETIEPQERTLGAYLQQISLLTDLDEEGDDEDRIKLMTIHAAKGLEFKCVFSVGLEENLFPSMMAMNTREDLEEERRLFYVAVTRAEKFLYLTYAGTRYKYGQLNYCEPSRFLEEVPEQHLEYVSSRKAQAAPQPSSGAAQSIQRQRQEQRQAAAADYLHKPSPNFVPDSPEKLNMGMQVEHQRFGFGRIVGLEGNSPNRMATIDFAAVGPKKLLLKFAKLRISEAAGG
ncbi:MAG: AAA family ATPase [Bacteroidetes bacterium]|nr:AAA family ATPase [Bacteroidota bacterium]